MERYMTLRQDTNKYTQIDVYKEVQEVVSLVGKYYPEVTKNTYTTRISNRMSKTLGQAKILRKNAYEITINSKYLKSASPEHVHQTIFHEICHCIPGCFNHGQKWKEAAQKISKEYNIELITRTTNDKNYHEYMKDKELSYKYQIVCSYCNARWTYKSNCRTVKLCRTGHANCPYCKGKEFKIITY